MMHAARIAESPRLQRVVAFLRERGNRGATSLEIAQECAVVAPSTYISELRANGLTVRSQQERTTDTGARVWRYWLVTEIAGTQMEFTHAPA
jgi:hypothetical protein